MKKSLTINATRNGKKVSKSLGFVNPDVANSIVGGFAQMVNALSTDTFVNAEVVKKMDTTEEEQQSSTPTPAKQEPTLTINANEDNGTYTYDGDGQIFAFIDSDFSPHIFVDRVNKTYSIKFWDYTGSGKVNHTVYLYATEGTNYTAKLASLRVTLEPE